MNKIIPAKLLNSKWTSLVPMNRERHFIVVRLDHNEQGQLVDCVIEAVLTKRQSHIDWQQLKDAKLWRTGWH